MNVTINFFYNKLESLFVSVQDLHHIAETALEESQFMWRNAKISELVDKVWQVGDKYDLQVVSVWGIGGVGKTTFVRSVYKELIVLKGDKISNKFDKRA